MRPTGSHPSTGCAATVAPRFQHASRSLLPGLPETTVSVACTQLRPVVTVPTARPAPSVPSLPWRPNSSTRGAPITIKRSGGLAAGWRLSASEPRADAGQQKTPAGGSVLKAPVGGLVLMRDCHRECCPWYRVAALPGPGEGDTPRCGARRII